jgi:hypothetical protein
MLRRAIFAALIALFIAGAVQSQPICEGPFHYGHCKEGQTIQPNQQPASNERGSATRPLVVKIAPTAEEKAKAVQAAEEEHQKAAREWHLVKGTYAIAAFTFLMVAGTAALAFYTLRLWRATKKLATDAEEASAAALKASTDGVELARASLIATNRAWIHTPEVTVGSQPLIFYPSDLAQNGAQASVAIRIINVGNAPAIKVSMHAQLIVLRDAISPVLEQARLAEEVKNSAFGPGITLFPKEVHPDNIGAQEWSYAVSVSKEDIDKALLSSPGVKAVLLYVIGCIDYTFPADPLTHHQTGFIRELRRRGFPGHLRPEDGDVPFADLEMVHSPMIQARPAD